MTDIDSARLEAAARAAYEADMEAFGDNWEYRLPPTHDRYRRIAAAVARALGSEEERRVIEAALACQEVFDHSDIPYTEANFRDWYERVNVKMDELHRAQKALYAAYKRDARPVAALDAAGRSEEGRDGP